MQHTGCSKSNTQRQIYTCEYLHYKRKSQINNLNLHLKTLKELEQ